VSLAFKEDPRERVNPGEPITEEGLQILVSRYHFASQFVSGKSVLEVGCGNGLGSAYLAEKAGRLIGGDVSNNAIKYAQNHFHGKFTPVLLNGEDLPFLDGCFDVVVAAEVIEHLSQPEDFVKECRRVLNTNGILVLSTPNSEATPSLAKHPCHKKEFSPLELRELLQKNFREVSLFGVLPQKSLTRAKLRGNVVAFGGKLFDLLPPPQSQKIKWFVRKNILREPTVILDSTIFDEYEKMGKMLEPFPLSDPAYKSCIPKILYAVAKV